MKKFLTLMLTGLLVVGLCSCSYAPSAGTNDAPYDGGYYLDATPVTGAENSESYTEIVENPFVLTSEESSSYFSIDANTASYPKLRSLIRNGYEVPKDAVRVEEMLNYFDYNYETPADGEILSLTSAMFPNPYNSETMFLTIGLAAQEVEFAEIKNNLVNIPVLETPPPPGNLARNNHSSVCAAVFYSSFFYALQPFFRHKTDERVL